MGKTRGKKRVNTNMRKRGMPKKSTPKKSMSKKPMRKKTTKKGKKLANPWIQHVNAVTICGKNKKLPDHNHPVNKLFSLKNAYK